MTQTTSSTQFNNWLKVTKGLEQPSFGPDFAPAYKFVVLKNDKGDVMAVNSEKTIEKHTKSNDINFSTAKVLNVLFEYNDIKNAHTTYFDKGVKKEYTNEDLSDSISSTLLGLHFNSYQELKEHFAKIVLPFLNKMKELQKQKAKQYEYNNVIDAFERINPFPGIKLDEYKFIDWKEIWAQMGHIDDFKDSEKDDIGLTASHYEEILKENPDYADLLDKMNSEADMLSLEERLEEKKKFAVIIINGIRARIYALSKCPQAKEAVLQNYADLKRVLIDLYNTFKGFPVTGDKQVDDYLTRCSIA